MANFIDPSIWNYEQDRPGISGPEQIIKVHKGGFAQPNMTVTLVRDNGPKINTTMIPPPTQHKDTNPKDAVGIAKVPLSCVPLGPVMEGALGMFEGGRKYGRHNYREAGVRASVYFDACIRHLFAWWEGQDIDPDSGLSHVGKAIASLFVLRDAMMNDMWTDDRPPSMKDQEWIAKFNDKAKEIISKYPEAKEAFIKK